MMKRLQPHNASIHIYFVALSEYPFCIGRCIISDQVANKVLLPNNCWSVCPAADSDPVLILHVSLTYGIVVHSEIRPRTTSAGLSLQTVLCFSASRRSQRPTLNPGNRTLNKKQHSRPRQQHKTEGH